jgi:hypothetical protein
MKNPNAEDPVGQRSTEDLETQLASADPADAPEIAEELADRLESVLDDSEERGGAPAGGAS